MSESKGPRPVAWRVGAFSAEGGEGAVSVSEFGEVRAWPADVAEARAYALIMAAAVARGEQGHTAALNRVSVALGHGHITADHGSRRTSLIGLQDERSRVVEVLVDAGIMAHGGDTAEGVRSLVAERDRLRRDCDAAAEACGVAVVGHVPEAWRLLSEARDEAVAERDAAREALAASRHALGVVGNGSPVLAAWSLRHECSALREDLAAAEAARAEAAQEAARLRVELSEAREALAGKTQHDAAAEVVAPAREPMTHHSLASIEQHGVVVGDRLEHPGDDGDAIGMVSAVRAAGARWMMGPFFGTTPVQHFWPLTIAEAPNAD